jgi:hypothetical protein
MGRDKAMHGQLPRSKSLPLHSVRAGKGTQLALPPLVDTSFQVPAPNENQGNSLGRVGASCVL